jgi:hypothetical protein
MEGNVDFTIFFEQTKRAITWLNEQKRNQQPSKALTKPTHHKPIQPEIEIKN